MQPSASNNPAETARPLAVITRPWFWFLFIGTLWGVPLVRALSAELPEPVPGHEGPSLEADFLDEYDRRVSYADLGGHLVIVSQLPMGEDAARTRAFTNFIALRKRLRGLSPVVLFAQLADREEGPELTAFLDSRRGSRKPSTIFARDGGGQAFEALKALGKDPLANYFLLDRHARLRGVYRHDAEGIERLVVECGQLANWIGADPVPGEEIRR